MLHGDGSDRVYLEPQMRKNMDLISKKPRGRRAQAWKLYEQCTAVAIFGTGDLVSALAASEAGRHPM